MLSSLSSSRRCFTHATSYLARHLTTARRCFISAVLKSDVLLFPPPYRMDGDIAANGRRALLDDDGSTDAYSTEPSTVASPLSYDHNRRHGELHSKSDTSQTTVSLATASPHAVSVPLTPATLNNVVLLAAFMAALGGFLFGYDVGVISGALLQLSEEFELSDVQKELVVSIMLVGAIAASVVGGYIVDYVGRRDAIVGNAVVFVVGAIVLATARSYSVLLFGRFLVGFGVSLSAVAEVIYISEIAPPATRGLLVSLNEMGITVGILVAYGINYALIATPGGWRWMFGLSAIPAVVQGVGMLFLPKSPRWLVLREQPYAAQRAMRRVRGPAPSDAELDVEVRRLERSLQEQHAIRLSQLLTDPVLRRCLLVACGLTVLQQFTGQPNVLYYGSTLFKAAGFESDREATLANMVIGAAKVVATGVALLKVDKLGRRPLLLVGVTVMVASLLVLASVTHAYPPVEVRVNSTDSDKNETAGEAGRRREHDTRLVWDSNWVDEADVVVVLDEKNKKRTAVLMFSAWAGPAAGGAMAREMGAGYAAFEVQSKFTSNRNFNNTLRLPTSATGNNRSEGNVGGLRHARDSALHHALGSTARTGSVAHDHNGITSANNAVDDANNAADASIVAADANNVAIANSADANNVADASIAAGNANNVADASNGIANANNAVSRQRRRVHPPVEPETKLVFQNSAVKWTSMVCMVCFVVAYAFSFGPVTWLILSELFPDDIRGRAVSLATIFNWGGNLVVSLTFLSLLGT